MSNPPSTISCGAFSVTAFISLEAHGKGTKYTALAIHKDEEGGKKHEEMGFDKGWGNALDQLVAIARKMG